ncbi:MAG: hypothetical protein NC916_02725 [Candidatus Omnitrophica bacterium]|nr:hypothetical protein [Candidatus Omnitrophota bacterium]
MCFLVGRIIVQKGQNQAELIQNAKNTFFGYSPAHKHNELSGLQGGTIGEFYHLSNNQHGLLVNGAIADSLHTHRSFGEITSTSIKADAITIGGLTRLSSTTVTLFGTINNYALPPHRFLS